MENKIPYHGIPFSVPRPQQSVSYSLNHRFNAVPTSPVLVSQILIQDWHQIKHPPFWLKEHDTEMRSSRAIGRCLYGISSVSDSLRLHQSSRRWEFITH